MNIKNCCNELTYTGVSFNNDTDELTLIIQCFFCGKRKQATLTRPGFNLIKNAMAELVEIWNKS